MKSTVLTAAAAFVLILTGCAGEAPVKTTINTVDPHDTLNPVHNRDDSVELYNTTRAGASLRQNEAAHVLWNEHYAANADELKAREAALAAAAEKERLEKEKAAKEKAEKAKAATSGKNAQSAKNGKTPAVPKTMPAIRAFTEKTEASTPRIKACTPKRTLPNNALSPFQ